uniref:Sex peptide 2A n=1 Tax=Hirudo verbana TaxID=311461 RepID=A0A221C9G6_9ANNE|nr:sex peptide 2A [Hirudo verbana]
MVQHSYHSSYFLLLTLIFLAALSHKEVTANVALRPYQLDGDYNHGYRRYSIFRRQSKGDTGFRTDLGKRFSDGIVQAPMKYLRYTHRTFMHNYV